MILPLAAAVTVVLDGCPVRGYTGAFEIGGHVFASVRPYVTRIADRTWFEGDRLAIERGGRIVYVRITRRAPDALDRAFVPLGQILSALGADVGYDGVAHVLDVRIAKGRVVETPSPFDPALPQVGPNVVFTPVPVPTLRPNYTGPALPRRTPLPVTQGTSPPRLPREQAHLAEPID